MSKFLSEDFATLAPYVPGEQPEQVKELIKLNTNENPYGPSPKVREAITAEEIGKLMLYPDPEAASLVKGIAEYYGLDQDHVMVGNGSDEILGFSFLAFQNKERKIFFPDISYGFYPVYEQVFKASGIHIPLDENLRIRPEDYANLGGTIVIANPNAPTGMALELDEIEQILEKNKNNLVIIDEAYVDFGAESAVPLIKKYDNLLVVQTFSKSRSLAGSRLGFAIADCEIIRDLNTIKYSFNPYNMNRLSMLAAAASIKDTKYFEETRAKIIATRERTVTELKKLEFSIFPSKANFIFVRHDELSGPDYFTGLREHNIIVRHFDRPQIEDYVRITIGTDEQMDVLIGVTKKLLEEKKYDKKKYY